MSVWSAKVARATPYSLKRAVVLTVNARGRGCSSIGCPLSIRRWRAFGGAKRCREPGRGVQSHAQRANGPQARFESCCKVRFERGLMGRACDGRRLGSTIRMRFTVRAVFFGLGVFAWARGHRKWSLVYRRKRDRGVRGTVSGECGESITLRLRFANWREKRLQPRAHRSVETCRETRFVLVFGANRFKPDWRPSTRPTESQVFASSLREAIVASSVSRACEAGFAARQGSNEWA